MSCIDYNRGPAVKDDWLGQTELTAIYRRVTKDLAHISKPSPFRWPVLINKNTVSKLHTNNIHKPCKQNQPYQHYMRIDQFYHKYSYIRV